MGSFGLSPLIYLPILVAQWIGVIAIGKGRRSGPWWCMLIGVALATLSGLVLPLLELGALISFEMWDFLSLLGIFGSLLFMVGFVMHALGFRRVCERVSELEMVIEAQNEQISREG